MISVSIPFVVKRWRQTRKVLQEVHYFIHTQISSLLQLSTTTSTTRIEDLTKLTLFTEQSHSVSCVRKIRFLFEIQPSSVYHRRLCVVLDSACASDFRVYRVFVFYFPKFVCRQLHNRAPCERTVYSRFHTRAAKHMNFYTQFSYFSELFEQR